jgi:Ca-activated chloride channel homolog
MLKNSKVCLLKSIIILASGLLMSFTWGDTLARKMQQGNDLFAAGKYAEALQAYTEADVNSVAGDPRLPNLYYNIGNTLTQQGQFDQAAAMYQKALEASKDSRFKADVEYNSGNALLKKRDYQKAIDAYKKALESNPKHAQARQNMEMATKLVQQQQQQNQEQKQDKQQQQQQNQQNQQQDQQNQPQQSKPENQQTPQPKDQPQAQPTPTQAAQAAQEQQTPADKEQQLSKEEALRVLDALDQKEKLKQQAEQVPPRPVEKDW